MTDAHDVKTMKELVVLMNKYRDAYYNDNESLVSDLEYDNMMDKLKVAEDEPVENKMLTRSIEQAQTSVESRNFQARKNVLEYDDVMNKQREVIYGERRKVLFGEDVREYIMGMMENKLRLPLVPARQVTYDKLRAAWEELK